MSCIRNIRDFKDIHSHRITADDITVANLSYFDTIPSEGFYSIGIHPWMTDKDNNTLALLFDKIKANAGLENVVAIGECGIDLLRGASIDKQKDLFIKHIELSESVNKPLILHAVKSFDILLLLKKKYLPSQEWIIHGFRGKPQLASQLLDNGFSLSFGEKFNPQSVCVVPDNRIFFETDESNLDIDTIRCNIEKYRNH